MSCNTVVLTYLEWVRLVGRGWLRLHRFRVVPVDGWAGPRAQVDFDVLMENAPDVGLSATDYVIAELKFEAWTPISMDAPQLGRVLKLDQVQRFSCFNESARQVMNATYSGPSESAVQLFEQPALWTSWLERVSRAFADNRAEWFLAHLNIPTPSDQFKKETTAIFAKLPDTHHKSKGTRAFGWVTALAIPNQNLILSDKLTQGSEAVKSSVKNLLSDYQVDDLFFDSRSSDIAKEVLSDKQYEKVCNTLLVCAAYVHYAYLMQRSNYKNFGYDAFCKDVSWLKEKNIDLAAQLVDKTARYMPDELLSRVLSQNPKIPAKSPASSEGSALTPGAPSSTAISKAPDTAPNLEDAGKKEATSALPSPSSVSSTPPVPEKSLAHLVADSTGGYQANKPDITGIAADTPQGQSTTKVNADAAPAPEEQIEPNAEAEEVSGTLGQSESTDPGAGNEYSEESVLAGATGADQESATEPAKKSDDSGLPSDDPKGNDSAQSPINGDGCTSAPIEPPFNTNAKKMEVAKRVREKGLEKVCEEMSLKPQQVQKWVDKFDQKPAKGDLWPT